MEDKNNDPILISQLIAKSILGELSVTEKKKLEGWLREDEKNGEVYESYKNGEGLVKDLDFFFDADVDSAWERMQREIMRPEEEYSDKRPVIQSFFKRYKMAAAAAVIFIVGWMAFLTLQTPTDPGIVKDMTGLYDNDVLPGDLQALLTLSNGKEIRFTEPEGLFSGGDSADGEEIVKELVYHTLSVPKGGTFNFTLADGSKVFMNSESEIQFPKHFLEDRRVVKLKGEAYFEVAKNERKPFVIEVGQTNIEVLGTEFNVNSTSNGVITTLVEGSVKLLAGNGASLVLEPGELGNVTEEHITKEKANLRKMLAWKNNEFYFKDDRFADVLSQLALWYDLDVVIEKGMGDILITGGIDRNVKLSETLEMLKYVTKGSFKIEGRKLTVMKP